MLKSRDIKMKLGTSMREGALHEERKGLGSKLVAYWASVLAEMVAKANEETIFIEHLLCTSSVSSHLILVITHQDFHFPGVKPEAQREFSNWTQSGSRAPSLPSHGIFEQGQC